MKVFQTLLAFSGNAPPQLALTRELVGRGHQVRVLAHRAARERIEETGAEFVARRRSPTLTSPAGRPIRSATGRRARLSAERSECVTL
jgi:UDP:flavonoid glycosyltransferase YjiC (YdhE family)